MTANQNFRLFQIANKYFKNEDDIRSYVAEIEGVVENKFENKATNLATRDDLQRLEKSTKEYIQTLELSIKTLEVKMEQGFKDQFKWIIIRMPGFSSLIITVVKVL